MDPTICVSFATVKWDGYDYFEASVGSLLEGLDPRERSTLCLNILFRDTDPSRNPSWGQKWTDRLVDKTGSYDVSEEEFSHLQELEKARNFHEKGIFDCIYSLRICTTTNASYIAIFEEDNIIADGWMVKTLKALSDISYRSTQNPWIDLRLFYTETLMSWSLSDFAYRNMIFIFLVVQLAVFAGFMLRRRLAYGHPYLHYPIIGVICLLSVPSSLGLTYMTGFTHSCL
ncbi:integral membrane protein [Aspergillus flavus AF70]|nr:integral membrane protein [Aspergillus flavus AF70]